MPNTTKLDSARLRRVFALAIETFNQLIPNVSCPDKRQRLEARLQKTKQKMEALQ